MNVDGFANTTDFSQRVLLVEAMVEVFLYERIASRENGKVRCSIAGRMQTTDISCDLLYIVSTGVPGEVLFGKQILVNPI